MTEAEDFILTQKQAAERLGISTQTLVRMQARGDLPRVQISDRRVGYRHSDISNFLNARAKA
jgi:excisionase family DNA binding protein